MTSTLGNEMKPELGRITWLVNPKRDIIGFYLFENGFYVIGGPTGSHMNGHSDDPITKWQSYLENGYRPELEAKQMGLIPMTWNQPQLTMKDRRMIYLLDKQHNYRRYSDLKPWWALWW